MDGKEEERDYDMKQERRPDQKTGRDRLESNRSEALAKDEIALYKSSLPAKRVRCIGMWRRKR